MFSEWEIIRKLILSSALPAAICIPALARGWNNQSRNNNNQDAIVAFGPAHCYVAFEHAYISQLKGNAREPMRHLSIRKTVQMKRSSFSVVMLAAACFIATTILVPNTALALAGPRESQNRWKL